MAGPDEEDVLPTTGAERSLVTVFLRDLPLLMSASRAFWELSATAISPYISVVGRTHSAS